MLTTDRNTPASAVTRIAIPVAAGATIHAGGIVMVNATGFAVKGQAATGLTYAGRAEEAVTNSGADGDVEILVRRKDAFQWKNDGSINQSHLLKQSYVVDDETVSSSHATNSRSEGGVIVGVEGDKVWIE